MRLLDCFRPKWKSPDPLVREAAVRGMTDQRTLEKIARTDSEEKVRLAAIETLADQSTLADLARGNDSLAVAALHRLKDRALLTEVALSSESPAVRELALDRIDDAVILHRIATSDTDARIRAKAKNKRLGPDATRDYIRTELSKLKLAQRKAAQMSEFCGSLNEVCSALIGDGRFAINGGLETESAADASGDETTSAEGACAQFLAFRRNAADERSGSSSANIFYQIKVWRTDRDTFECTAEEKRLALVQDAVVWSRVSNGGAESVASVAAKTGS